MTNLQHTDHESKLKADRLQDFPPSPSAEKVNSVEDFKAGFISLVGKPNVGKSVLMNTLLGENLCISSPKVQTTRHRILGMFSSMRFQMIFSDTPGLFSPRDALHKRMLYAAEAAFHDSDILLYMVAPGEAYDELHAHYLHKAKQQNTLLLLNKIDLLEDTARDPWQAEWQSHVGQDIPILQLSGLHKTNIDTLLLRLEALLPSHPPYFPIEQLTDKSERFVAAEIIREKIFMQYKQEIPYSVQVEVVVFEHKNKHLHIHAYIYVERMQQKPILIGAGGKALKRLGKAARMRLEAFFGKKVYLETMVKVAAGWRKDTNKLKAFGYGT